MNRLDAMLDRLPPNWRTESSSLLHQLFQVVALAQAIFDEDMDRVQRSHWVDHAFDRTDLERLGALFDIPTAAWEPTRLYRDRLKAIIAARLQGAVTRADLELALSRILDSARQSLGLAMVASPAGTGPAGLGFSEFPARRTRSSEIIDRGGLLQPLDRFHLDNRGIEPVPLQASLRGMAGDRTAVPVLANLITGQAMGFAGLVRCGQELTIVPDGEGVRARLDGQDVTHRLFTGEGFADGERFEPVIPDPDPAPFMLARGRNQLWFVSMAFYDVPGLDAAMIQVPSPQLRQGRFLAADDGDGPFRFDRALFQQPPAVCADLWWDERRPARFRFEIPMAVSRMNARQRVDTGLEQDRLLALLEQTVDQLRAAAVDGGVSRTALVERQAGYDRIAMARPDGGAETNLHADLLSALGALFDFTAKDGSRFA